MLTSMTSKGFTKRVSVSFTPEQDALLTEKSDSLGIPKGVYLRLLFAKFANEKLNLFGE